MSIQIIKNQLTSGDVSTLESYFVSNPHAFSHSYELTPHHTTFSKDVSVQLPTASLALKIPDSSNNARAKLIPELITDTNNFTIDSFSKIYVLPEYTVQAEAPQYNTSTNPNYAIGGILHVSPDTLRALDIGANEFALNQAPQARAAIQYISNAIAGDPFGGRNNGYAQDFNVSLPLLHSAGGGPHDPPVILKIGFKRLEDSSGQWPADQRHVSFFINTNSAYYNQSYTPAQLFNIYIKHVLEAMGWQRFVIGKKFSSDFSQVLESLPLLGGANRHFLTSPNVLAAYKSYAGDSNITAVPMGNQQITKHLFAGGYHSDRFDTADFYFAELLRGGPLNEPIPHPALMGEILATNSIADPVHEEFLYKRHSSLNEEYFTPNFIITKAAMGMLEFSFHDSFLNSKDTSLVDSFFNKGSAYRAGSAPNLTKIRIRNYSDDKLIIRNMITGQTENRQVMIDRNYNVSQEKDDKSVKQALRYFGYIPFGNVDPMSPGPGRGKSAVFVSNGTRSSTKGLEIFSGGPNVLPSMDDYRIYISANALSIHRDLGLNTLANSGPGKGLLYNYFMAEAISCVICVGDDALDLETPASAGLSSNSRNYRKVLVLHKDFEI